MTLIMPSLRGSDVVLGGIVFLFDPTGRHLAVPLQFILFIVHLSFFSPCCLFLLVAHHCHCRTAMFAISHPSGSSCCCCLESSSWYFSLLLGCCLHVWPISTSSIGSSTVVCILSTMLPTLPSFFLSGVPSRQVRHFSALTLRFFAPFSQLGAQRGSHSIGFPWSWGSPLAMAPCCLSCHSYLL